MSDIEREAKAEAERFFGKPVKLIDRILWPPYKAAWAIGYVYGATRTPDTKEEP